MGVSTPLRLHVTCKRHCRLFCARPFAQFALSLPLSFAPPKVWELRFYSRPAPVFILSSIQTLAALVRPSQFPIV